MVLILCFGQDCCFAQVFLFGVDCLFGLDLFIQLFVSSFFMFLVLILVFGAHYILGPDFDPDYEPAFIF